MGEIGQIRKDIERESIQLDPNCYGSSRTVLAVFVSKLLLRRATCLLTFLYDCNQSDRGAGMYKSTVLASLSGSEQLCDC
jgi:hypothetical protein